MHHVVILCAHLVMVFVLDCLCGQAKRNIIFMLTDDQAPGARSVDVRCFNTNTSKVIVETMLVIVHWVLWLAPIGVLALAFSVGARLGIGTLG